MVGVGSSGAQMRVLRTACGAVPHRAELGVRTEEARNEPVLQEARRPTEVEEEDESGGDEEGQRRRQRMGREDGQEKERPHQASQRDEPGLTWQAEDFPAPAVAGSGGETQQLLVGVVAQLPLAAALISSAVIDTPSKPAVSKAKYMMVGAAAIIAPPMI